MKSKERLEKVKEFLSHFWDLENIEISQWYNTCYWIDEIEDKFENLFFCWWVWTPKKWWVKRTTTKKDIIYKNYFAIDIDLRKQYAHLNNCDVKNVSDESLFEQIASIKEMLSQNELLKQWSYIVFTWNWCHIYYIWNKQQISADDYQDWVKEIYRSWNIYTDSIWWEFNYFYSDNSTANIDRILRLPYSFNAKETNPHWKEVVKIIYQQDIKCEMLDKLPEYAKQHREFMKSIDTVSYAKQDKTIDSWFMVDFVEQCNKLNIRDVLDKLWVRYTGHILYEWDRKTSWWKIWNNWVINFSEDASDCDRAVWRPYSFVKKYLRHNERKETINRFKNNFKEIDKRCKDNSEKYKQPENTNNLQIPVCEYSRQDKAYYFASPVFDNDLWCIYKWELVTIVAEGNSWKTTFALDMILRNTQLWSKCFYLNLEFPLWITFEKKWQDRHWKNKISMTQLSEEERIDLNNYVHMQLSKFDNDTIVWISLHDLIQKLIELKTKWYELVFIDTFSKIDWNMSGASWNSQNECMTQLQDFVGKTWMSLVVLHHTNKKKDFSGSQKIFDLSNVFLTISANEELWDNLRVYELKKDKNTNKVKIFASYEKWEYKIIDEF